MVILTVSIDTIDTSYDPADRDQSKTPMRIGDETKILFFQRPGII